LPEKRKSGKDMSQTKAPEIVLLAITRHGCNQVINAARKLPDATIAVPEKFADRFKDFADRLHAYEGPSKTQIAALFKQFDQIVFFVSLGAVVRLIAPHLVSKETDPGILVVDDAAQYVIPVLSGHVGGANAFAEQLAGILKAIPILTTASDARKTISVDILGRELGWIIEAPKDNITRVSAHMVNDESIAVVQECGSKDWWQRSTPLPDNIHLFDHFDDVDHKKYKAVLWITHQKLPSSLWREQWENLIVYRPPEEQGEQA
jgi:cobalt-precorrin 5A hydrolase